MNEAWIQRKIIERHQKAGWFVIKLIQCSVNGLPDLMLLRNGRCVFIEVKRPGGKAAPLQVYRHRQLQECGFEVHLTSDVNFMVSEMIPPKRKVEKMPFIEPFEFEMEEDKWMDLIKEGKTKKVQGDQQIVLKPKAKTTKKKRND